MIPLSERRLFGVPFGAMESNATLGAKLISVFQDNFPTGILSRQGLVVLFEPKQTADLRGAFGRDHGRFSVDQGKASITRPMSSGLM